MYIKKDIYKDGYIQRKIYKKREIYKEEYIQE